MPLLLLPLAPASAPTGFRQWTGTTEIALTLDGVWNGTTIQALQSTINVQ